jgi:hypothetical protein
MYQELLERVAEEQLRFESKSQPPATEQQISKLEERAVRDLKVKLPDEYLDFLRRTNGLDWNGVVVFASETVPITAHPERAIAGLVEMNLGYRDDQRFDDLVVLGSNGMDIYTYRVSTRKYEIYDEVPHELIESLSTFDDLMTKILTRSLQ